MYYNIIFISRIVENLFCVPELVLKACPYTIFQVPGFVLFGHENANLGWILTLAPRIMFAKVGGTISLRYRTDRALCVCLSDDIFRVHSQFTQGVLIEVDPCCHIDISIPFLPSTRWGWCFVDARHTSFGTVHTSSRTSVALYFALRAKNAGEALLYGLIGRTVCAWRY
jgi:hypothetical protein